MPQDALPEDLNAWREYLRHLGPTGRTLQEPGARAELDKALALLGAQISLRNAASADRAARRLTWATWALVLATVVLAVAAFTQ